MTRDEIYRELRGYLINLFEIPEEAITPQARLAQDLDLDSIDAVDLVLKLQELTGRKISVEQFQSVRTINDVIDQVHGLFAQAV
jgi:acyl carrier protein